MISRRTLLRRVGAAAAVTIAAPSLTDTLLATTAAGDSRAVGSAGRAGLMRLNRNENAYGPSARVIAAMREQAVTEAHRYADVPTEALRSKVGRFHAVSPDQVVLGCGSSEILHMAIQAFAGPGKKVILAVPTFELLESCAERAGADVVPVPLNDDCSHNLDAMLARSDGSRGLVYICNPNNPTGTLTSRRDLEVFLRRLPATVHVVIDEAYHHYVGESSDYASFIDRSVDDPRVIVVRTFSKIYALAGLRVGYAVAAPQTARLLGACRLQDNVNAIGAAAALAALDEIEHVNVMVQRNADDRQEFFNQANARMLKPIDSHTNFVMVNTGRPAVDVVDHFGKNGVAVSGPFPFFPKSIRVSLGTPAEMHEFWRIWDLMPFRPMMM